MNDVTVSGQKDSLVSEAIALAESGNLAAASAICVDILQSAHEMRPLLGGGAALTTLDDTPTSPTSSIVPEIPYILGLGSLQSDDLDRAWRCFEWVAREFPQQTEAPHAGPSGASNEE